MTKTFRDENGRRWKAWLASRDVFWPDPEEAEPDPECDAVLFVCFSDPQQAQRRAFVPSGSFDSLSVEELKDRFVDASPDPSIR